MNWECLRADFPILDQCVNGQPLIYFDNAASSQRPSAVIDAVARHYRRDHANVHRGLHELSMRATTAFEAAREKVARFIGAGSAGEIVFTRGTTEAINLVAQVWAAQFLRPGDVILLTGMEHHSNLVPWQFAAQRSGAVLKHVPVLDDGALDLNALELLLTEEVKIFAFVHVSNTLGVINPVTELCQRARAVGAVSLVDGAQAVGHLPVDVAALGCDFYAFSGHKMLGPTGIGALYGREEWLERMLPWHGGGEMIASVTLESCTFKTPPHRFEAGTPDIAGAIGLGAAIDYLKLVGTAEIEARCADLTEYALAGMTGIPGLRTLGPVGPRGALVSFTLDCAHPHDLVEYANSLGLALRGGHHCTQPLMKRFRVPGTTRASFHFYNTRSEVDRMIDILRGAVTFFG